MEYSPGSTFEIVHPGTPEYLWVVCSKTNENDEFVIFSLIPWRPNVCDEQCIVERDEHPFITRKSIVDYQLGRQISINKLSKIDELGCYIKNQPVSNHLLKRIQQGAIDSMFTPQKLQPLIIASMD